MRGKIWSFVARNPVPLLVLIGLVVGALLRWGFARPDLGRWAWLAALLLGGAPLVVKTVRGLLRGNFASDVVATLSI